MSRFETDLQCVFSLDFVRAQYLDEEFRRSLRTLRLLDAELTFRKPAPRRSWIRSPRVDRRTLFVRISDASELQAKSLSSDGRIINISIVILLLLLLYLNSKPRGSAAGTRLVNRIKKHNPTTAHDTMRDLISMDVRFREPARESFSHRPWPCESSGRRQGIRLDLQAIIHVPHNRRTRMNILNIRNSNDNNDVYASVSDSAKLGGYIACVSITYTSFAGVTSKRRLYLSSLSPGNDSTSIRQDAKVLMACTPFLESDRS